jgi:hypothetical protein
MRRAFGLSGCGLLMSAALVCAQEDAWRPAASPAPAANSGVRLGKPIARAKSSGIVAVGLTTEEKSSPSVHTARYVDPIVVQQPPIVPGVPSVGVAATPEEDYNCGVVTGPAGPRGPGVFDGVGNFFHGIFGGDACRTAFQSDHRFDGFISPVSNPFFFEDPRALTELRPIFIYQHIPGGNPLFKGGDIEGYYLQGRLAFNEYFSIVIHKLGVIAIQPDEGPAKLNAASGFSEFWFGPKFSYGIPETNTILAAGLNIELATGSGKVFQNTGDGAVTPYISVAQQFGDNWHVMGTFGYRLSFDSKRSDSFFASFHLDYGIYRRIYPLVELNWYHFTANGKSLPANFEGEDLINFGSTHVSGNDVVTLAGGVRFKIVGEAVQAGIVFEAPVTKRHDIMDYRVTADLIFRY